MWEFSYIVRREAPQAEYADWSKVLDEAWFRGYNCLRIDVFPHLIAEGDHNATILPQPGYFMWGNNQKPVEVNPYRDVVEFMHLAAKKGFKFGLSTWLNADLNDRRGSIREPEDLIRIWDATLRRLAGEHLLQHVLWVDLLNEFPMGQWGPGIWKSIFGTPWPEHSPGLQNALSGVTMPLPWSKAVIRRADAFLTGVIPALRASFPDLRYTFSMQGNGISIKNMQKLNVSEFDIAELHLWLSDDLRFFLRSGQVLMMSGPFPKNLEITAHQHDRVYRKHKNLYHQRLKDHIDNWHDWASSWNLPLVTTEAWGPVNWDDVPGDDEGYYWEWVKDIGAIGATHALCKGWLGVATSNFAQPHFPGMWRDAAWHANLTGIITRYNGTSELCDNQSPKIAESLFLQ